MQNRPIITLTTDFGLEDPFVGVMKGAILTINPWSNIVDLNHGIASHDIKEAAFSVAMNYKFFPERTVHVVVVDPGVGSRRRPLLVVTENHYFIGPDNGVFSLIYEKEKAALKVIHITADHYFLKLKSPTFQGRDVFAPVAAWLTSGKNIQNFGEEITDYTTIALPVARVGMGSVQGEIIYFDKFGNAVTNIGLDDIDRIGPGAALTDATVFLRGRQVLLRQYYGHASDNELYAVINSSDSLEFFVNRGNAAELFSLSTGDTVEITVPS